MKTNSIKQKMALLLTATFFFVAALVGGISLLLTSTTAYANTTSKITECGLSLRDDLVLKFTAADVAGLKVGIVDDRGELYNVEEITTQTDGAYEYHGVAPHLMGETVKVSVIGDETDSKTISIKDYCNQLLTGAKPDGYTDNQFVKMKLLAGDILNYGAAAQTNQAYKTDELVNTGVATTIADRFDDYKAPESALVATGDTTAEHISGMTLRFGDTIGLQVVINATDIAGLSLKVTKSGTSTVIEATDFVSTGKLNEYKALYANVLATEYATPITAQLYKNDAPVGNEVTYSVNSYIARMASNDKMSDLVKSLHVFGSSAVDFVASRTLDEVVVDATAFSILDTYDVNERMYSELNVFAVYGDGAFMQLGNSDYTITEGNTTIGAYYTITAGTHNYNVNYQGKSVPFTVKADNIIQAADEEMTFYKSKDASSSTDRYVSSGTTVKPSWENTTGVGGASIPNGSYCGSIAGLTDANGFDWAQTTFKMNVDEAGSYRLIVRGQGRTEYAANSTIALNNVMYYKINDNAPTWANGNNILPAKTDSNLSTWEGMYNWTTATVATVTLNKGDNNITLYVATDWGVCPNLDYVTVEKVDVAKESEARIMSMRSSNAGTNWQWNGKGLVFTKGEKGVKGTYDYMGIYMRLPVHTTEDGTAKKADYYDVLLDNDTLVAAGFDTSTTGVKTMNVSYTMYGKTFTASCAYMVVDA